MRMHPSIAISLTALVVAVFGSTPIGEAAWNQVLPPNSVGTPQLKRNAVTRPKLAPNAVRSAHVLDGSLLASDFRVGQLAEGVSTDDPGLAPAPPTTFTNQFPSSNVESTFSTSRAAKLLLLKDVAAFMNCPSFPPHAWWWLTLDGAVVPGSLRSFPSQTTIMPLSFNGVTAQTVPAGQHTLAVGAMCASGTSLGTGFALYSAGSVVLLG
jgi:hypothetical protein